METNLFLKRSKTSEIQRHNISFVPWLDVGHIQAAR